MRKQPAPELAKLKQREGRAHTYAREHILGVLDSLRADQARLPSERKWCEQLNLSRSTVRQALLALEMEGLIQRRGRSGWYPSPPRLRYDPCHHVSLARNAASQGRMASWKIVKMVNQVPPPHVLQALDLKRNRRVPQVQLLIYLDDVPFGVDTDYIHPAFCSDIAEIDHSRAITDEYARLTGSTIIQKRLRIRWTTFGSEFAGLLGFNWDSPALSFQRTKVTAGGEPVAFEEDIWHAAAMELDHETDLIPARKVA